MPLVVDLRFNHNVVARPTAIGARLTIAGDAGVDQTRIDLCDAVVVHAVLFERTGEIILNEYIAVFGKLVQYVNTGLVLE